MSEQPVIGIDLGTTNTCISFYKDGKAEVILSRNGKKTTPSFVSFTDKGRFFGQEAKNKMSNNIKNTIYGAKRLIGKRFFDETVQAEIKYLPYEVVNENGKPLIRVQYAGETKQFIIEEISSMILSEMKKLAEDHLKQVVCDVVIAVPASFNNLQRQATEEAGKLAGLNVLRMINEPTAAAIAYAMNKTIENGEKALVYDFGGGTFDVTILEMNNGIFEVKYTDGDSHLGGEDIDALLCRHFVEEIHAKNALGETLSKKSISRLLKACEIVKCDLSSSRVAELEIEELAADFSYYATITREEFNKLCDPIIQKTLNCVQRSLKNAKIDKSDIKFVVLNGGSSRILRVKELLKEYFVDKIIENNIDADVAVSQGAAIQAALLRNEVHPELPISNIVDVVSLSLGIDTQGGLMAVIIARNTPIPAEKKRTFVTVKDDQEYFSIRIYEGERARFKDNILLGSLRLEGIKPGPRETQKMEVTFKVDFNGIFSVTAESFEPKVISRLNINHNKLRLSPEEISKKLVEAERYRMTDEKEKNRIEALLKLTNYAETAMKEKKSNSQVNKICKDTLEWISLNKERPIELYVDKLSELQDSIE